MRTRDVFLVVSAMLTVAMSVATAQQEHALRLPPEHSVERDRLIEIIRSLPEDRSAWGDENSKAGLRETEEWLFAQLESLGLEPRYEPIPSRFGRRDGRAEWRNIIVDIEGAEAETRRAAGEPVDVLIVGAHFDAVPNSPGADDNGTGVATLLEAARLMPRWPTRGTVRLAFYNLEEAGLIGSTFHADQVAEKVADKRERIIGMISLDMLGYYSEEPGSQIDPLGGREIPGISIPDTGDFLGMGGIRRDRAFNFALERAMNHAEPRLKVLRADSLPFPPPDFLRSDHAPFLTRGMPAVILSDTANFRNPHYHKPTDTLETLDLDRFEYAARAVVGAMYRLAGPAPDAEPTAPEAESGREPGPAKEETGPNRD